MFKSKTIRWQELMTRTALVLICASLLGGCGTKSFEDSSAEKIDKTELCYVKFYLINNQVKIYIDDKLVADTGLKHGGLESEETVVLSDYLSEGKHKIRIELINGEGLASDKFDRYWEIYYELFLNGVPIDYINEMNDHAKEFGKVWSNTHEITIE